MLISRVPPFRERCTGIWRAGGPGAVVERVLGLVRGPG